MQEKPREPEVLGPRDPIITYALALAIMAETIDGVTPENTCRPQCKILKSRVRRTDLIGGETVIYERLLPISQGDERAALERGCVVEIVLALFRMSVSKSDLAWAEARCLAGDGQRGRHTKA